MDVVRRVRRVTKKLARHLQVNKAVAIVVVAAAAVVVVAAAVAAAIASVTVDGFGPRLWGKEEV